MWHHDLYPDWEQQRKTSWGSEISPQFNWLHDPESDVRNIMAGSEKIEEVGDQSGYLGQEVSKNREEQRTTQLSEGCAPGKSRQDHHLLSLGGA